MRLNNQAVVLALIIVLVFSIGINYKLIKEKKAEEAVQASKLMEEYIKLQGSISLLNSSINELFESDFKERSSFDYSVGRYYMSFDKFNKLFSEVQDRSEMKFERQIGYCFLRISNSLSRIATKKEPITSKEKEYLKKLNIVFTEFEKILRGYSEPFFQKSKTFHDFYNQGEWVKAFEEIYSVLDENYDFIIEQE